MAKVSPQITDTNSAIATQLSGVVYLPKITCPYTTVVKRALCTDPSNDLLPRFAGDRVMTQQLQEVQGETGPNGERVWKPINDTQDFVRIVGNPTNTIGVNGQAFYTGATVNDYIEITYYGTGLNLLTITDNSSRAVSVTTDGVADPSVTFPASGSNILQGRGYSSNQTINIVSGKTLGTHTTKITWSSGVQIWCYGYEVLNTTATLQQTPGTSYLGGKRLYAPTLTTSAYNTTFESGTLGTRGGAVQVYQKSDGTIAKAVNPTNASPAYLASADHTNESVIRTLNYREVGASRNTANAGQAADDFSSLNTTAGPRAFTLDDGTTTLVCSNGAGGSVNGVDALQLPGNGNFWTLTFVGTGLDIIQTDSANGGSDSYTLSVDGAAGVAMATAGSTSVRTVKLCSGLPYGTHTVKVTRVTAATFALCVASFIIYAPTMPAVPSGALALGQYYIAGDYSVSSTSSINFIAPGVLRKFCTREFVYSGTWTSTAGGVDASNFDGGWEFDTATSGSFFQHTNFGTGYEFRGFVGNTHVLNATFTVDGLALNTGTNTGATVSLIATGITGLTLSAAGVLTGTAAGAGEVIVRVTGLTPGLHTFKYLQNGSSVSPRVVALDVVTPIHCPKYNGPGIVQNTLSVGSCGIGDQRQFSTAQVPTKKAWAQAVGVASNPPLTSPATVWLPIPDMSLTVKTSGNPIQITFDGSFYQSTTSYTSLYQVYIDGVAVGKDRARYTQAANATSDVAISLIAQVSAGVHKIDVYWWNENVGMTVNGSSTRRNLSVLEL